MRILGSSQAELLVNAVIARCSTEEWVTSVVTSPNGEVLAEKHRAGVDQRARMLLVREVNMAVQRGEDIFGVLQSWVVQQPTRDCAAPVLAGVALRIYARASTQAAPRYPLVGVIGLLGVDAARAVAILTSVVSSYGFFLFIDSDSPQASAQD